ncbi:DNA-3-methyladenine glycosylase I [Corynebacterium flavescens]|uniref:DNA-3-methyladenine glycosylase I n=1 Tax=Corynebacterium flavescens TaxID=28028 RepID=UPI003FD25A26
MSDSDTPATKKENAPSTRTGLVFDDEGKGRPPWAVTSAALKEYYDTEWGTPIHTESGLLERLVLEGFQAGLSWSTVLHKRPAFRAAMAFFDADKLSHYGESEVAELLANPAIIRNERKIRAAIRNAQATVSLREKGGLNQLIWSYLPEHNIHPKYIEDIPTRSPESEALAKALKHEGFTFVGPTTCYALMEAIGMVDAHLVGSHRRGSSGVWAG